MRTSQTLEHHPWSIIISSLTPYQQGHSMLQLQVSTISALMVQTIVMIATSLLTKNSLNKAPLLGRLPALAGLFLPVWKASGGSSLFGRVLDARSLDFDQNHWNRVR